MLKIKKIKKNVPVYDITVHHTQNFFDNKILVHNCVKVTHTTNLYNILMTLKERLIYVFSQPSTC